MDHWSWAISGFGVMREDNSRFLVQNSLEIVNRNEDVTKADGCTFRHLCFRGRSIVPTDLNYFLMVSISIQMSVLSCRDACFPNVLNGTCASVWRFPKGLRIKGLVLRVVLRGDGGTFEPCDPEGGFYVIGWCAFEGTIGPQFLSSSLSSLTDLGVIFFSHMLSPWCNFCLAIGLKQQGQSTMDRGLQHGEPFLFSHYVLIISGKLLEWWKTNQGNCFPDST